ncbi:MAG: MFS transporter [Peptococcaceae bacterium]|nr:MFS transporter [Peptococcaceae bacterium]
MPGRVEAPVDVSDSLQQKRPPLWTRDFILICIYNLIIFISFQMLMPTIPVYVAALGGNDEIIVGLVTGFFTVSAVLVRPWAGQGLDRYGRLGIWLVGAAVFVLAVVGYNWALTIPLLLALRVIHGAGWGVVTTAGATAATDLIPPPRRGEGMGFFGLGANLGMAVGPAMGFFLVTWLGFPTLFWSSAALALVGLLLITAIRLPEVHVKKGGSAPALWEPTAVKPALLVFFATFVYGGVATFIILYGLQQGIPNPGIFFTVYAITLIITRPVTGALFDCYGHRVVLIPGFLLLGAGMVILSLTANLLTFLAAAVISGLGFGFIHPALQALAVARCAPNRRGAAQATFTASFDVGIGIGSVLLGALAQFIGYSDMYLAAAGMAVIGLLVYLMVGISPLKRFSGNTKT